MNMPDTASSPLLNIQHLMDSSGVRFGTSGARGLVADMSAEICYAYTAAFLQVIAAPPGSRVALGIDLRPSSPDIARACAAAIQAGRADGRLLRCAADTGIGFPCAGKPDSRNHGHRQPYPVRPQRHQVLSLDRRNHQGR
jgi:hypothetical protein